MTQFLRPACAALAFACLTLAPGCSGGGKSGHLVPVSGVVTVDGAPVTSGQVSFLPVGTDVKGAGLSTGTIESDGKYTISTNGKSGAPVGSYKVTVTPSMMPTGDKKQRPTVPFNDKYRDVGSTTLKIDVVEGAAPGHYDLKLTK